MLVREPAIHLLGSPTLQIGDERISESSGGRGAHVYAAAGTQTTEVVLAGPVEIDGGSAGVREFLRPKNVWIPV